MNVEDITDIISCYLHNNYIKVYEKINYLLIKK